ncbi:hypothetical protein ACNQ3M_26745, partial [Enterobacter cloacae complex sp.6701988]
GYARLVGASSVKLAGGNTLLGALEVMRNDGPWTLKEGLRRTNGVVTLAGGSSASGWSASLMGYDAHWHSTDQVPQRLIEAGSYLGQPFG